MTAETRAAPAANFLSRLEAAWRTSGSMLCVGLDPDPARLPSALRERPQAILEFCRAIVDATAAHACAFKPQIAYFAAARAEDQLEQALSRLIALKEAYPDLKASDNFQQLSAGLVTVEDHLQYARRFYNGAVRDYNDAIQRFPALLIAPVFGFRAAEFFQAEAGGRAAPILDLGR